MGSAELVIEALDGAIDTAIPLRNALAAYATGVTVVTTVDIDGAPAGLTVNSFTSLSLDPPMALWCLRNASSTRLAFASSDGFVVNVLGADQLAVAERFCGPPERRFDDLSWIPGPGGLPVLRGTIATFLCRTVRQIPAGDHVIVLGELFDVEFHRGPPPLVFFGGRYHAGPNL